jgi:hypothetical protein
MNRQLTEIANECGTDKGTVHGNAHGYTAIYEQLFRPFRELPINLLEIGLAIGGPELDQPPERAILGVPSIKMWHEYLPNAKIYGLDISDASAFQTDWFKFFHADCGSKDQLSQVRAESPAYRIIVDDGSHASYHQQLTLVNLFGCLEPGGLYIIEDLDWVPETYERTLPKVKRTNLLMRDFVRTGKFPENGPIPSRDWDMLRSEISSVSIYTRHDLAASSALYRKSPALVEGRSPITTKIRRSFRPLAVTLGLKVDDKLCVIQKRG